MKDDTSHDFKSPKASARHVRAPISEEYRLESRRLNEAIMRWNASVPPGSRISKSKAAAMIGISPAAFGYYTNGKHKLNINIAVDIRRIYGIEPSEYSERLHSDIERLTNLVSQPVRIHSPSSDSIGLGESQIRAWDSLNSALVLLADAKGFPSKALLERIECQRKTLHKAIYANLM